MDIRLARKAGNLASLMDAGNNITSVNWPACGEIDIMELTGDLPNRVLATVHYGPNVSERQYKTGSKYLSGNANFQDEFHVFSMIWKENLIEFL
ncbi:MAG: family 16 glycosylhydrolase [Saprospiraceae bacterium]|nr:family 16 glycosylhydrolase [Saprospiraceae bacterium]